MARKRCQTTRPIITLLPREVKLICLSLLLFRHGLAHNAL